VKFGTGSQAGDDRTRDAVARLVLERGPQTAAALAEVLGLSAAAIRRHLDALVADGLLEERQPRPSKTRGRGRPARIYALTDRGRSAFPHAYDDLASTALAICATPAGRRRSAPSPSTARRRSPTPSAPVWQAPTRPPGRPPSPTP